MSNSVANTCIFCRIVQGLEDNEIIYQNDDVCVFRSIRPGAKHHLLAVSKVHIKDAKALLPEHKSLVENLLNSNKEALKLLGDDLSDVRYGFHWPPFHTISHLHMHALSPASDMGLISRLIFRENSYWFVTADYVLSNL